MRYLLLFVFFILSPANAALQLELTKGLASALPIAIVNDDQSPSATLITQTIQNDLHNSGEFKVAMLRDPIHSALINAKKNNDQYLIQPGILASANNQFAVKVQLYSLVNDKVILTQEFHSNKQGLRALSHHISDIVFEKLTGSRGVFSTKFAYVLIQRNKHAVHYNLAISDADGVNQKIILTSTQPIMSPSWSANGRSVFYVSFEEHHSAIYRQNIASAQRTLISTFPGINGAPAASPDNTLIALVLSKSDNPNLYLLNPATHKLKQLTHDYGIDTEPNWSADKRTLYFTSNRAGGPQIYKLNTQTLETNRVTFDGNYNARASVSGDDKSLAMIHREDGKYEIATLDLSSGRSLNITEGPDDGSPSMAPNGKMVLYETKLSGRSVLALVSIDGRVKLTLPAQDGDVQDPAWSPYLS